MPGVVGSGLGGGVAEHGREGAVEDRMVRAPRAQHGAQREVDVAALDGSIAAIARAADSSSPVPTRTPPARSSAASVVRRSSTAPLARRASAGSAAPSDTLEHPQLPHPLEVLADLERDAERVVEIAVGAAERDERLGPRDRLPHARELVELHAAQARDGVAHALGDRLGARPGSRARTISASRVARRGSRSSGRGSGA